MAHEIGCGTQKIRLPHDCRNWSKSDVAAVVIDKSINQLPQTTSLEADCRRTAADYAIGLEACRTIARQRWGRCTAFRMGIVAGEIGARIVNPYRGKQASLFREGLRRSRPTRAQAGVKARELGVREDLAMGYWEVLG